VNPPESGRVAGGDGVEIATASWTHGDGGPDLVLVHATGFCKEVAAPVVDELSLRLPAFRAVALDQRAHGDSAAPPPPYDWWDSGRDVLAVLRERRGVIGIGHSSGGALLLLAELLAPGTFRAMVLVEPIVLPPPYGTFPDNPMSVAARRRTATFPDRAAARRRWERHPTFAAWDPRAFDAYLDGGLRRDGDGWALKCSPDAEAASYIGATQHRAWDRLVEVAPPVLLVAGAQSASHPKSFLAAMAGRMPSASSVVLPGTSHFVWMERPDLVAAEAARFLASDAVPETGSPR
jgi:pimeloyl-ACP methyl ester carboxylesterase